ncbi:putative lipase atg15 [Actinomortierella ambigua]|nr:putative lipase atg15 [Actinomortierella ambigua]
MLHHGGHQYPKLFRRKDIQPQDRLKSEMLTGESLSHQINVRATTTLKPRDRSFRSQGFRALGRDQSIAPGSWTKEVIDAPDVMEKDTLIQLAKLNYNSYSEANDGGWYDLEGKWSVNSTFGWEEDGVRGHVFASDDNSTLIMAIKGTTAGFFGGGGSTVIKDKLNDNLLFSCCCGKLDWSMRTVCGCHMGGYRCDQICVEDSVNTDDVYYNIAMKILWNVQDMYPDADVWLTGHSLGGGLSSLLAQTFGVPAITFEIPGDRLAAQRLHLPGPPAIQWEDFPLYHVGHTADPVFQGTCTGVGSCRLYGIAMESKCHTGRTCVYDPVTEDGWSADIRKHRLKDTIEGVLMRKEVPKCLVETGCVDCGRWEYVE